MLKHKATACE